MSEARIKLEAERMRSFSWRWSLILSLLLLLASSMAGCVAVYGKSVVEPTPSLSPSLTATNETGSSTALTTVVATPAEETLVGCDPVTGRNQEFNLKWEQLCIAVGYDIEIAKDTAFTQRVFDWMLTVNPATWPPAPSVAMGYIGFNPSSLTSPAFIFPVAGAATAFAAAPPALVSALECGHTYYWKVQVRQCATGQVIRSPWSEVKKFTIKAGLPVSMPYYSLQLLAPDNGCLGCPVKPVSFSWSPFKDTTKYKFVLAKDAAMTQVVVEATPTTTGYGYEGQLDYSQNYFWRVMSMEPAPSDWSATFSFMTQPALSAPAASPGPPATPMWVWVVIGVGAILVIVTVVLILAIRRG